MACLASCAVHAQQASPVRYSLPSKATIQQSDRAVITLLESVNQASVAMS